ncbi:unnamed protein product [Ceutorhynchus assimilis]|uniref:Glutamine amidotransferase type-2 domain-containing protein n=1 Tax=Ceutorhynchus assimilis TaxID=467358 RepID=A0A9N9MKR4_9CUCU|nr:unnamed protein product [Ceutorhynchus assimilis]
MCGIFCVLCKSSITCENIINKLSFEENLKNRGPNSFNFKTVFTQTTSLAFAGSVLWLQGTSPTEQPLEDSQSIFCFNGDIFAGLNEDEQKNLGDTKLFHDFLKEQLLSSKSLNKIQGPYAFIFFDKLSNKLYFGRDIFGRRSLLIGKSNINGDFILTSVAKRNTGFDFIEMPSVGIFCYDIINEKFQVDFWQHKNKNFYSKLKILETFLSTDISIAKHISASEDTVHNFIENDNLALLKNIKSKDNEEIFNLLLNCDTWMHNVIALKKLLENAVKTRICTQPKYCNDCLPTRLDCQHATTGILFSGGVDCAILAALTDKFVDKNRPIDLLNVSFDEAKNYQSPDRITGLQTLEELRSCYPERKWNFIEVNVPEEELDLERSRHIADLIYPLNTILDDSLGCALWFASRGKIADYTSPCRILVVGMGADELFGGYTRHRTSFRRYSWKGLQEILDEDWMNLPYRNLGRDDRVVSDHGRQLRTPYLDENVVEFVRGLECWEKTYPSETLPQGVGEKILLRSLASHLGLRGAAVLKKRALQFGSRIANAKENAHDISHRLV